jgi:hypothetical protein
MVDPPEQHRDILGADPHPVVIGDVGRKGIRMHSESLAKVVRNGGHGGGVAVDNGDACPFCGEGLGDSAADAARPAYHDCGLSAQPEIHGARSKAGDAVAGPGSRPGPVLRGIAGRAATRKVPRCRAS